MTTETTPVGAATRRDKARLASPPMHKARAEGDPPTKAALHLCDRMDKPQAALSTRRNNQFLLLRQRRNGIHRLADQRRATVNKA